MTRTAWRGGEARGTRAARWVAAAAAVALGVVALGVVACEPWPRDPENTLERAAGATLRVGVTDAPPSLMREGEAAAGPEAELVEAFARSIGARPEWRWGAQDAHLEALERRELDVVAGGLSASSPWKQRVGFTRPWRVEGETRHVLAVPPGENRTLVALDRLIEARRRGRRP